MDYKNLYKNSVHLIESTGDNIEDLISNIVKTCKNITGAEGASILQVCDDELVFRNIIGGNENLVGMRFPLGQGYAGMAAAENRPYMINTLQQDLFHKKEFDNEFSYRTENLIAAPFEIDGEVSGVIEVVNKKGGFNEHDRDSLVEITSVISSILSLYDRVIIKDKFTGLISKKPFKDQLKNELNRCLSHRQNHGKNIHQPDITLLMYDIDHFKKINDNYGHQNGDVVLKQLADLSQTYSRKTDLISRYGGEEFIIAYVGQDKDRPLKQEIKEKAEKFREEYSKKEFSFTNIHTNQQDNINSTISLGLASMRDVPEIRLLYGERGADLIYNYVHNSLLFPTLVQSYKEKTNMYPGTIKKSISNIINACQRTEEIDSLLTDEDFKSKLAVDFFIKRVDEGALYKAKNNGRNQLWIYQT